MTGEPTVLVVDDDDDLRLILHDVLDRAGFRPLTAASGESAIQAVFDHDPAVVILDLGLPDVHGFDVVRRIREYTDVPILLLTARALEHDKVRGLGLGADDYVTKPFGNGELVARVHALLRRAPRSSPVGDTLEDGPLHLDLRAREARLDGREIPLTPTEWGLVVCFVTNPGRVLSTADLLDLVWGDPAGIGPGRVKYAVLRLRRRFGWEDPGTSPIEAVRGVGYRYRGAGPSPGSA